VTFDEDRRIAVAAINALEFRGDPREHGGVRDLYPFRCRIGSTAPSVAGFWNCSSASRRERRSRLAVADDGSDDRVSGLSNQHRTHGSAHFRAHRPVDRARRFGRNVTGDAARERELLEEPLIPSASCERFDIAAVGPSSHVFATMPGPPCPDR
jgi:hypothetical protein